MESSDTYHADYGTPADEQERLKVNEWIRRSHAFDGVIDFDRVVRDPANPGRMLAVFDSGDHLHPSDAGFRSCLSEIASSSRMQFAVPRNGAHDPNPILGKPRLIHHMTF